MSSFYRVGLIVVVSAIFCLGLVLIFNTTSAEVLDHALSKSTHGAINRQMLYCLAGLFLAVFVRYVGYENLLKFSPYLLGLFTVLLVLCLIPGVGRSVNGSRRWIQLFGFSFQPSEFVKYLIPGYLIQTYLSDATEELSLRDFLIMISKISVPAGLILIEPNNGTVGVIGLTVLVLFIMARIPLRYWVVPLISITLLVGITAYHLPYVQGRLKVYLNPELDLKGKGHQPHQAKIAAGSGKLWGKGPGNSLQKLSYLPEAQNDYIAAIFAEEFGFVGMCVLMLLYMSLALFGFTIAHQAADHKSFYLATCITFLICFQAFMNLGVVSGLLPSTGLNLPFFSQGGTSLMANIMGVGILFDISKKNKKKNEKVFSKGVLNGT